MDAKLVPVNAGTSHKGIQAGFNFKLFLRQLESGRPNLGDRVVAEISVPILSMQRINESASRSRYLTRTDVDGRPPESWSRLLLDLYERTLNGDKRKLLSIEAICCHVVLIRQRLRSW